MWSCTRQTNRIKERKRVRKSSEFIELSTKHSCNACRIIYCRAKIAQFIFRGRAFYFRCDSHVNNIRIRHVAKYTKMNRLDFSVLLKNHVAVARLAHKWCNFLRFVCANAIDSYCVCAWILPFSLSCWFRLISSRGLVSCCLPPMVGAHHWPFYVEKKM